MSMRTDVGSEEPAFPFVDVLRLRPLDGYWLWLRFTDGSEGIRDLSDVIAHEGPMIEPLRDPDCFKRVFIEMGVLTVSISTRSISTCSSAMLVLLFARPLSESDA